MDNREISLHKKEKATKPRIRPHSALLIVSAVLLAFPDLHVIDLLPDAVAYLMLLYVIAPYAMVDSHIFEAQKHMEHMLLISAAQMVSVPFILVFLSRSPQEQPMTILLCCFVFAFFRIKTVIPLVRELGDGLMYLDTRNDGTMFCASHTKRLLGRSKEGKRRIRRYAFSVTDRMMRAARTFIIASSVLNSIPELAALSYVPDDDTVFNMYDYISLLRGFFMIISLFFGVVFICRVIRFAKDTRTDLSYYARLNALYQQDKEQHPERETQKYLRRTFVLITLFAVFTMDFSLDRVNVLPDFFAALLLLAAFLMLRRHISHVRRNVALTLGYAVASAVHFVVETRFWERHQPESIYRSERIRALYVPVQVLSLAEMAALLGVMIVLYFALCEIIERYTGYEIEGSVNYSREEKLQEEHRALRRSLLPAAVLGLMTVLSGPMYTFLRPSLQFAWMFNSVIPAVFAVVLTTRLMRIRDGIDSRYLLK